MRMPALALQSIDAKLFLTVFPIPQCWARDPTPGTSQPGIFCRLVQLYPFKSFSDVLVHRYILKRNDVYESHRLHVYQIVSILKEFGLSIFCWQCIIMPDQRRRFWIMRIMICIGSFKTTGSVTILASK